MGVKNVSLEGPRTQPEILGIMQSSDIFLLPSRLEGIPKVTLEAAAYRLALYCISRLRNAFGRRSCHRFSGGLSRGDDGRLGKAIADRSLRERMGAAARQHMEKFDWDVIGRQWQNAYLEIAAARVK